MSEAVHEVWDGQDSDDAGSQNESVEASVEASAPQDGGDEQVPLEDDVAAETADEAPAKKKPNIKLIGAAFVVLVAVVSVGINSMVKRKQVVEEPGYDAPIAEQQSPGGVDLMGGSASAPDSPASEGAAVSKAAESAEATVSAVAVDPVAAAASNPMMKPAERAAAKTETRGAGASGDILALGEKVSSLEHDVSAIRGDLSDVKSRVDALLARRPASVGRSDVGASAMARPGGVRRTASKVSRVRNAAEGGRDVRSAGSLAATEVVAAAPGVAGVAAVTVDVPKEEPKPVVAKAVSAIAGMKLRAVFPAAGPDAQAWVVDGGGRVYAVVKGDKLNGETVTSISREGVGTSGGMIRPE